MLPEPEPLAPEQLLAEAKSIYAGLLRVKEVWKWTEAEIALHIRLFNIRIYIRIYILLLYHLFFESPGRIRHLCTTMPWTIWPALVVLWGICWMFIQQLWQNEADEGIGFLVPPEQVGGMWGAGKRRLSSLQLELHLPFAARRNSARLQILRALAGHPLHAPGTSGSPAGHRRDCKCSKFRLLRLPLGAQACVLM